MFPGFSKKKKAALTAYDPSLKRPALRCSICTGEQVAGFKNLSDGSRTFRLSVSSTGLPEISRKFTDCRQDRQCR